MTDEIFWRVTTQDSEVHIDLIHPDGSEVEQEEFDAIMEEFLSGPAYEETLIAAAEKHLTTMRQNDKDVLILTTKEFFT